MSWYMGLLGVNPQWYEMSISTTSVNTNGSYDSPKRFSDSQLVFGLPFFFFPVYFYDSFPCGCFSS